MVKFMIFRNFVSNILLKSGKIKAGPLVFYVASFFSHRRIFRFHNTLNSILLNTA